MECDFRALRMQVERVVRNALASGVVAGFDLAPMAMDIVFGEADPPCSFTQIAGQPFRSR